MRSTSRRDEPRYTDRLGSKYRDDLASKYHPDDIEKAEFLQSRIDRLEKLKARYDDSEEEQD